MQEVILYTFNTMQVSLYAQQKHNIECHAVGDTSCQPLLPYGNCLWRI